MYNLKKKLLSYFKLRAYINFFFLTIIMFNEYSCVRKSKIIKIVQNYVHKMMCRKMIRMKKYER